MCRYVLYVYFTLYNFFIFIFKARNLLTITFETLAQERKTLLPLGIGVYSVPSSDASLKKLPPSSDKDPCLRNSKKDYFLSKKEI